MKLLHPKEFIEKCEQVEQERAIERSSEKEMYEAQRMMIGGKVHRKVKVPSDNPNMEKTEWVLETPDMEPLNKEEIPKGNFNYLEIKGKNEA